MCVRIQMPLVDWVGFCRDTRLVEGSSPWTWSEFWTCCITLGKSFPCLCLYPHSKLCPSTAYPCHSFCCGGAQGHGLHGTRACFSVQGGWDMEMGSGWAVVSPTVGLGLEVLCWGSAAGHPAWHEASLCSCPTEGILTTARSWCLRGGESRASSGPSNPLIPLPSSPDPTAAQVWVQKQAQ